METELTRLARVIALLGREHQTDVVLDKAGYLLLRTLEKIGPASINALAHEVNLDGSTVTRQVSAMKQLGLVNREINPDDRRSCIISPTANGRAAMRRTRRWRRKSLDSLTHNWAQDDLTTLSRLLASLNEAIVHAATPEEALA